jgi:hypothetical protein
MSTFDQLVAKYRNLSYGRLTANNPSALQNVISQNNGLLGTQIIPGTGNYFETIPENEMNFIDTPSGRVAQNRFRIDPTTGQITFGTPGGQLSDNTGVYDSSIDYGDPGYDNPFRVMTQEERDRRKAKSDLINEFKENKYLDDRVKESKLPGLLGILENFFDTSYGDMADDVLDSQPFGVNKFGIDTTYEGSSSIDRDPADFGTPSTGVSGVDEDTGKFSSGKQTGSKGEGGGGFGGDKGVGQDAGTVGGTGGRRGGAGRAGY